MKITRTYEVWTGDNMVVDYVGKDYAMETAREEMERELKEHPEDPANVVVDETIHYSLETMEDVDELEETL